jgi:hypothetical protein
MKSMSEFSHDIKKSTMISVDDFLRNIKKIDHNKLDFGKDKKRIEEEVWEKLEKMEIIHIHGYLGNLKTIAFGDSKNEHYDFIVRNMKTIWEKEDKDKKIQHYFLECNRIFFLGFGWLEDNMRLLDLDNKGKKILSGKEIYGTAFKMSENKVKNIEDRLKLCGALQPNIKNCEAVNLIKDFFY